jgi:predicted ribosome quality control (RQC) complex YloA/Tae2 family protein
MSSENEINSKLDRMEDKLDILHDKIDEIRVEIAKNKTDVVWITRLVYAIIPVMLFCSCYCGYGLLP